MSPTLAEEGLTIPDAPTEPGEFERSLRATRESGRKLLIAYVTGGLHDEWPDVVRAVADAGADAIEIGIPFSDPVMDGPIIQEASELALRDGASPVTVLDTLRTIDAGVPLAVMTYYNLAFHMGHERFASLMYEAGVRAAILPDLPLEEVGPWATAADPAGIETVMLAAPTAPDERLPRVVARSRGFVYAVGLLGVTGERDALAESSLVIARRLKAITDKPVLVGVGVSNGQQAAEVSQVADGCVIGSALMRRVVEGEGPAGAGAFIADVRAALDAS
ncbi:MAG: tryptophan synthase subunit alpha [Actinobacteria bacterium]|jgi:tryptophan synthase alpha chain|nr:tryptophan synthase subunit alpha [Actinomycetota bacterium]